MPAEGVHVYWAENLLGEDCEWRWCLYIERTATEADLEQYHYLDQEGARCGARRWGSATAPSTASGCRAMMP